MAENSTASTVMTRNDPHTTVDHNRRAETSGRTMALLLTLLLVSAFSQIDRILPFILMESIKTDLSLSDTQMGLITGIAFAVCYALLSLPLARAADRGSPRFVLVSCIVCWSAMTALGGFAASFLVLALSRFGVAFGEAGAIPSGHALIVRKVEPERRGLAIGLFTMGIPLGTMVGFAAGGAINDTFGWRVALIGAGALGLLVALLSFLVAGPTPPQHRPAEDSEPFLQSCRKMLVSPEFRWLLLGAVLVGFASTPFYAFTATFLIRTHDFSASTVGVSFGLLQGLMGIVGALGGGRWFDRAVRSGSGRVLGPPGVLLLAASVTTTAALLVPIGWLSIVLMVPGMLSFSFLLPWGFGASHLVAGPGRQAQASSMVMIASGLLGPAVGPLLVGLISDATTAAGMANGLGLGLLVVPFGSALTGIVYLIANRRIAALLNSR